MTLSKDLILAMDDLREKYLNALDVCRKAPSECAIHDLRVAIRRLLSLRVFLKSIQAPPGYKKMRRILKEKLDMFDELRDVQVMHIHAAKAHGDLPGIDSFLGYLKEREEKLLGRLSGRIKKKGSAVFLKWLGTVCAGLRKHTIEKRLSDNVYRAADLAYGRVMHSYQWMDKCRTSSIHRVRVDFKRFRYQMEIISSLICEVPPRMLTDMHDYQTRLGKIQDLEVLLVALSGFYEAGEEADVVRKYYQREYQKAIAAYWKVRERMMLFWRSAPDAAFPWADGAGKETKGETR